MPAKKSSYVTVGAICAVAVSVIGMFTPLKSLLQGLSVPVLYGLSPILPRGEHALAYVPLIFLVFGLYWASIGGLVGWATWQKRQRPGMFHKILLAALLPVFGLIVGSFLGTGLCEYIFGTFTPAIFPLVAVCMFTGLVAGVVVARRVWRSIPRHPRGHCQNCGYDLTGNVSGTCPECGERR